MTNFQIPLQCKFKSVRLHSTFPPLKPRTLLIQRDFSLRVRKRKKEKSTHRTYLLQRHRHVRILLADVVRAAGYPGLPTSQVIETHEGGECEADDEAGEEAADNGTHRDARRLDPRRQCVHVCETGINVRGLDQSIYRTYGIYMGHVRTKRKSLELPCFCFDNFKDM